MWMFRVSSRWSLVLCVFIFEGFHSAPALQDHHADLNETYLVGNVDDRGRELVRTTYECLWKAINACKPGVYYRDLGTIISKHASAHGFDVVRTYWYACTLFCIFHHVSFLILIQQVAMVWVICFTRFLLYRIMPRTRPWER